MNDCVLVIIWLPYVIFAISVLFPDRMLDFAVIRSVKGFSSCALCSLPFSNQVTVISSVASSGSPEIFAVSGSFETLRFLPSETPVVPSLQIIESAISPIPSTEISALSSVFSSFRRIVLFSGLTEICFHSPAYRRYSGSFLLFVKEPYIVAETETFVPAGISLKVMTLFFSPLSSTDSEAISLLLLSLSVHSSF